MRDGSLTGQWPFRACTVGPVIEGKNWKLGRGGWCWPSHDGSSRIRIQTGAGSPGTELWPLLSLSGLSFLNYLGPLFLSSSASSIKMAG